MRKRERDALIINMLTYILPTGMNEKALNDDDYE